MSPAFKGQKYNIEVKPKIKEVFYKVVNSGKTMKQAVKEVYKNKRNQTSVKKSRSWDILVSREMPEKLIATKHKALLNKVETIRHYDEETKRTTLERTDEIDVQAVSKGLDMYYKVSNKYPKDSPTTAVQVNINRFKDYE